MICATRAGNNYIPLQVETMEVNGSVFPPVVRTFNQFSHVRISVRIRGGIKVFDDNSACGMVTLKIVKKNILVDIHQARRTQPRSRNLNDRK